MALAVRLLVHDQSSLDLQIPTVIDRCLPEPHTSLECSIAIPARNEQDSIVETLAALATQSDREGRLLDPDVFEILVLANNCTDSTASVVRSFSCDHPDLHLHVLEASFPAEISHIGTARKTVMDVACRRLLSVGRGGGIIAATDADTIPSPTWLYETMREFKQGVDAVCGRIFLSTADSSLLSPALRRMHLEDTAYRLLLAELVALVDPEPSDPWPRHHQHFGASFAVNAKVYQSTGGIPRVNQLEDMAFHDVLIQEDVRVRHSCRVQVTTSSRQSGKVALGLSTQLTEWQELIDSENGLRVPSVTGTVSELSARHLLRMWWSSHSNNLPTLNLNNLPLPENCLAEIAASTSTLGQFMAAVERYRQERAPQQPLAEIPILEAIHELRLLIAQLRPAP